MPSSSSKRGLRGPRPQPLKVARSSSPSKAPSKKPAAVAAAPVIVYEHTPRVVHARPQEFMSVVQRLTGKPPPASTTSSPPPSSFLSAEVGGDPLLLTLGQRPSPAVPSLMAAGLLPSPGFLLSPNTVQSMLELSPLF